MPWVEIEGTVYRQKGVVMTASHLLPEFAVIEDIVVTEKMECYLLCKQYETLQFHHHFHSFEVTLTPDLTAVKPRFSCSVNATLIIFPQLTFCLSKVSCH